MKKILPINTNPYIRTYTHHGYHHAVISSLNGVSTNSTNEVACLEVQNFDQYKWESQNKQLTYQIIDNNTLTFYSNKWNTDMDISFWRKCNTIDELSLKIKKQINSNVWSSIAIFITSESQTDMTDIDFPYEFQFGNYSKDGIYYRLKQLPHIILNSEAYFPLQIRLIKNDTDLHLWINDDISETITLKNISGYSFDQIGFIVKLSCNSYYEWLFSNYINVSLNPNSPMPMDYLCNRPKNWSFHTNDYFMDYSSETELEISSLGFSLIEYIKKMIDLDRYVETLINDNLNFKISDDNGSRFHQNLIYGYDDFIQSFHVLYYKSGKIHTCCLSYSDFMSSRNLIPNRQLYIFKYNPGYELYELNPKYLFQIFTEYKTSKNTSHYMPYYDGQIYVGISALKYLSSSEGIHLLANDMRISFLIYERSICNCDRIEYLYTKKIIDAQAYRLLSNLAHKECSLSSILNNLVIKYKIKDEINFEKLRSYLMQIIQIDIEFTKHIIQYLKHSI